LNKTDIKLRLIIFNILSKHELRNIRIDYLLSDQSFFLDLNNNEIRFIHNIIYGIIRNKSKLDFFISNFYDGNYKKLLIKYKIILRIGLYQILYVDSIPNYASVNSTVNLVKSIDKSKTNLINAIMRKFTLNNTFLNKPVSDISIEYSHPKWLLDKWAQTSSHSEIIDILKWNLLKPKVWFRVNSNKITIDLVLDFLKNKKIKYVIHDTLKLFFYCSNPQAILKSNLMIDGYLSVQDPANGLVVSLLNPKKSQIILDGCSAPGGKGIYINELTNGEAKIDSYDNNFLRLTKMKKRLKALSITNITCHIKDLEKDKVKSFEKGLIDVPCTGTGVISKRVDLKWRRKLSDINEMTLIQKNILSNTSQYLNVGGSIVYSTCSIEKEENWDIINDFLYLNNNFKLDRAEKYIPTRYVDINGCLSIFPPRDNMDGIFAARLTKNA